VPIAVRLLQVGDIAARSARVAGLMVRVQQPGAVVALDAVGLHERVQMRARRERKLPELVSVAPAQLSFEPVLIAPQTHMHLPAIAPGGAPSDAATAREA
jgi:hypothetical protein